jgi:RND family efflux transporter MFP subunit
VATLSAALYEPEAAAAKARAEAARARVAETQARLEWLKAGSRKEEIAAAAAARDKAQAKYSRLQGGYRAEEIAKSAAMLAEARTLLDLRRAIAERSRVLLERKQASIDQCQRDEAEAQAAQCRVEAHTAELARLRAGYLPSEIAEAKAELEEAAQRLKLIEAGFRQEEISAALAALEAAKADESAAQADAALAVQRLALCTVRAPISGRVLELFASQGSLLSDGKFAICSLYDPSEMQVRVDVRQEQIGGVRLYQPCLVKVGARREQPYEGEVLRLDPQANLARDTIRVKIKLADPDEHLHKDMTATVDFLADKPAEDDTERPLLLPRSAIVARDKKDFVFVIRGGYAKQVEVTLGDTVGSGVAVKSGVVFGDLVAVSNAAQLEDGTAVSVED